MRSDIETTVALIIFLIVGIFIGSMAAQGQVAKQAHEGTVNRVSPDGKGLLQRARF